VKAFTDLKIPTPINRVAAHKHSCDLPLIYRPEAVVRSGLSFHPRLVSLQWINVLKFLAITVHLYHNSDMATSFASSFDIKTDNPFKNSTNTTAEDILHEKIPKQ